jgi:hypothetical protein
VIVQPLAPTHRFQTTIGRFLSPTFTMSSRSIMLSDEHRFGPRQVHVNAAVWRQLNHRPQRMIGLHELHPNQTVGSR